jgi:hypothetical protein
MVGFHVFLCPQRTVCAFLVKELCKNVLRSDRNKYSLLDALNDNSALGAEKAIAV